MKCFSYLLVAMILFMGCNDKSQQEKVIVDPNRQSIKSIKMEMVDTLQRFDSTQQALKQEIINSIETVYTIPRVLPLFQGCSINRDIESSYTCSKQRLAYFVSQNISYPKEAEAVALDEVSVVQFVIDENGIVRNEKIVKSAGYGTDEVVLKMMQKMREEIVWTPGSVKQEAVKVLHTLPVRFSIH